jgi:hypothetical protein
MRKFGDKAKFCGETMQSDRFGTRGENKVLTSIVIECLPVMPMMTRYATGSELLSLTLPTCEYKHKLLHFVPVVTTSGSRLLRSTPRVPQPFHHYVVWRVIIHLKPSDNLTARPNNVPRTFKARYLSVCLGITPSPTKFTLHKTK